MKKFAICGVLVMSAFALAQPSESTATYQDIQKTLGFVPGFFRAFPDNAIAGAWDEMKSVQISPNTSLPVQAKQLIGLAVSAQIPCRYCAYFHTQLAKSAGASELQIKEAIAIAALERHWSTILSGMQVDLPQFKQEIGKMWQYAGKHQVQPGSGKPITDAASAYQDMERIYGMVPTFMRQLPQEAVAGAWRETKELFLDPNTALPLKTKDLISLAVSAQVPCTYCVYFDTEAARHDGATDDEIREAVAVSAITRHWSTVLNGAQIDEGAFRRDVDHMVKNAEQMKKTARQP